MAENEKSLTPKGLLLFLPTYNERANVTELLRRVKGLDVSADILFIDDNSQDGTGLLLEALSKQEKGIFVIHRPSKSGIGSAHQEALQYARRKNYKLLITMDADLTHSPEDIPRFLENAVKADVVVGSRFVDGAIDNRKFRQKLVSRLSHLATTIMLGMPHDVTNAFRLYRMDRIDPGFYSHLRSDGYAFFLESLYVLKAEGARIVEVPVALSGRLSGRSKTRLRDSVRWMFGLMKLRWLKESSLERSI